MSYDTNVHVYVLETVNAKQEHVKYKCTVMCRVAAVKSLPVHQSAVFVLFSLASLK